MGLNYSKKVAIIKNGWFKPQLHWYKSEAVSLAEQGLDGWRLATEEETADVWLFNQNTDRVVAVPFWHLALERAQDHKEGTAPENTEHIYATDEQIEQAKADMVKQAELYKEKQLARIADAAAKKARADGVA